jgi:predicted GIY-YIG superfamily endonuclease
LKRSCQNRKVINLNGERRLSAGTIVEEDEAKLFFVYQIQSILNPSKCYIGFSENLRTRFKEHNQGKSYHTNKYRPWKLLNYFAFSNPEKARAFEKYLKTGSGREFIKRHL